jgi:WD40 repeat protein
LNGKKGIYGSTGAAPMYCIKYIPKFKTFMSGTSKGELCVWAGQNIGKKYPLHKASALVTINEYKTGVITGGNDGKMCVLDSSFKVLKTIDLNVNTTMHAGLRSMDVHKSEALAIVGTKGSDVMEISLPDGKFKRFLVRGHSESKPKSELWGCCVSPKKAQFATCGADGTLRVWDVDRMVCASEAFEPNLYSCDWGMNGNVIVVGDENCTIHTLTFNGKELKKVSSGSGKLKGKKEAFI